MIPRMPPHRWSTSLALLSLLPLLACTDDPIQPERRGDVPAPTLATAAVATPPAATVSKKVRVPASMRSAPFDVDRYLTVPPDFSIAVHARVTSARFMAVAPNGDLLVSRPSVGKVMRVRPTSGGDPVASDFITGLRKPHDLVFHTIGGTTYLYLAESHQISRYVYDAANGTVGSRQIVVSGLPDASTPELKGSYGHELKNIALDRNHKLYVSIASSCNACLSDTESNPVRGAIYQYDATGGNRRLFARGLRNAEGLAFVPGTNTLWVVVNNRDDIAYPFNDRSGNYGRVFPGYVDNHPPELFTRVRDGGNYGWPFCNANPDTPTGSTNMPFDPDYQFNRGGGGGGDDDDDDDGDDEDDEDDDDDRGVNCAKMDRISKGIQAHSAPLGLSFLQGTNFPVAYRNGAVVGLHGSWNRTTKTGYKIIYFPWDNAAQLPGDPIDLVTGWLSGNSYWGRPVDAVVDRDGGLLISMDKGSAIFKLTYTPPAPPPPPPPPTKQAVKSFTLIDADSDQPIAGYDPLRSGVTINLAKLPSYRLSIRANADPRSVGSVRFGYPKNTNYRTESIAPYAIAGDRGWSDYLPWTPRLGDHVLTATPYTQSKAGGTTGTPLTVRFTVIDQP